MEILVVTLELNEENHTASSLFPISLMHRVMSYKLWNRKT
jgi:hypothetical protein